MKRFTFGFNSWWVYMLTILLYCFGLNSGIAAITPQFVFEDYGAISNRVLTNDNPISFTSDSTGKWAMYVAVPQEEDTLMEINLMDGEIGPDETAYVWHLLREWTNPLTEISYTPEPHYSGMRYLLSDRDSAFLYKVTFEDSLTNESEEITFFWVLIPRRPVTRVISWEYDLDYEYLATDNSHMMLEIDSPNAAEFWITSRYLGFNGWGPYIPFPWTLDNFRPIWFSVYDADPGGLTIIDHDAIGYSVVRIQSINKFGCIWGNELINEVEYIDDPELRSQMYISKLGYDFTVSIKPTGTTDNTPLLNADSIQLPHGAYECTIYNFTGEIIKSSFERDTIDIVDLPKGIYILQYLDADNIGKTFKFFKQ